MIQLRRGKTESWRKAKEPLAPGQPGYDKDKHKIKIGDGENSWAELEYASGLSDKGVLDSEESAKKKLKDDSKDVTVITYGTEAPNKDTVGQHYLQHYEADPEVDYVVSAGINQGWTYQKWKSGIAKCFITFSFNTTLQSSLGNGTLYQNSTAIPKLKYPFEFKDVPSETSSIQSPGGLVWLAAAKGLNTTGESAGYAIISPDKLNNAIYNISIQVEGFWR
jgi:hypothetical protein